MAPLCHRNTFLLLCNISCHHPTSRDNVANWQNCAIKQWSPTFPLWQPGAGRGRGAGMHIPASSKWNGALCKGNFVYERKCPPLSQVELHTRTHPFSAWPSSEWDTAQWWVMAQGLGTPAIKQLRKCWSAPPIFNRHAWKIKTILKSKWRKKSWLFYTPLNLYP